MTGLTKPTRRAGLAGGVGLIALATASGAFAQAPATIEEVVVTANKRAENLQDVPASISVLGGEQMERMRLTQLSDLSGYVAGLQVTGGDSPGHAIVTLRGVGPVSPGATVGIYIDETPLGSSSFFARGAEFALDLLPYDVERLEVLRGPQGTLYGANTIGGLLKYVTRQPDLDDFEVRAGADVFSIEDSDDLGKAGRLGVNMPVIPGKLAVRAGYAYQKTPGYIDNAATGREDQNAFTQQGGRVAVLWQATDNVSIKLAGLWQTIESDDNATVVLDSAGLFPTYARRTNDNRLREPFKKDVEYYSGIVNWDLGFADLVSATSYSKTEMVRRSDASDTYGPFQTFLGFPSGLSAFTVAIDLEKWTQELRLASKSGGKLEWLVGAFYTDEDAPNRQEIDARNLTGALVAGANPFFTAGVPSTYKEYAVFGDLTYRFTDRFDVTAGVRWAKNKQDTTIVVGGLLGDLLGASSTTVGSSKDTVATYMVSPRFHLTDDAMIYARVASGYRPGGPNPALLSAPLPAAKSDSLVNYEVGLKAQLMDRRLYIDAAVFLMDWKDIQITVSDPVSQTDYVGNGGTAESKGVELTAQFQPIQQVRLGLNAAYTDATFTETAASIGAVKGNVLPYIPKWSLSLTADYTVPLGGDWSARFGAGYRFIDDRNQDAAGTLVADSYSLLDVNAEISNDRWTARLFVKNLTDQTAYLAMSAGAGGVDASPLQPRTVGLAVDARF